MCAARSVNLVFLVGHTDEFRGDNIPSSTYKGHRHFNRSCPMYCMHPSNTPFVLKNLFEELWVNRKQGGYYFQATSSVTILDTVRLLRLAQKVGGSAGIVAVACALELAYSSDGLYASVSEADESILAKFIIEGVGYSVWHVGVHGAITDISTLDRHSGNRLVRTWGELLDYSNGLARLRNELCEEVD